MRILLKGILWCILLVMFQAVFIQYENVHSNILGAKQFQASMVQKLKIAKFSEFAVKECIEEAEEKGYEKLEIVKLDHNEYKITLYYQVDQFFTKGKIYQKSSEISSLQSINDD